MSYHSRRMLTPGPSRKRKEREDHQYHHHQQPFYFSNIKPSSARAEKAVVKPGSPAKPADPVSSNRLLAGCMAHEFLTKGTLFGQKFDPARAEAVPVGGGSVSGSEAEPKKPVGVREHESYAEVASLLKTDGAHIAGVFNPTQLARWIQM